LFVCKNYISLICLCAADAAFRAEQVKVAIPEWL
jgi:hypothetical protein